MSVWFPLHNAVKYNNVERVEQILAENVVDVNQLDNAGKTPLHYSSICGNENVAEMLLNAGADVNQLNRCGWTPLFCAAFNGHEKLVALLIDAGADLNHTDSYGWTPLYQAVVENKTHMIACLINAGADVNKAANSNSTPLYRATVRGREKLVALLIDAGAEGYRVAERQAARRGRTDIVAILRQGMRKQEHCRLVSLATLFRPLDLPVLVVYKIYSSVSMYKEHTVSRFDAWRVLTEIKQCEKNSC